MSVDSVHSGYYCPPPTPLQRHCLFPCRTFVRPSHFWDFGKFPATRFIRTPWLHSLWDSPDPFHFSSHPISRLLIGRTIYAHFQPARWRDQSGWVMWSVHSVCDCQGLPSLIQPSSWFNPQRGGSLHWYLASFVEFHLCTITPMFVK